MKNIFEDNFSKIKKKTKMPRENNKAELMRSDKNETD